MVNRQLPLHPRTTRIPVGSPTTAKSHGSFASSRDRIPLYLYSSSTTQLTVSEPLQSSRERRRSSVASIPASGPFMSVAPRPHRRPSRISPLNGSIVIPATLTVSVCPLNRRCGPSPWLRVKLMLSRPSKQGCRPGSKPLLRPQFSSQSTTAPSPGLAESYAGFTLGMRTSSWAISVAVMVMRKCRAKHGRHGAKNLRPPRLSVESNIAPPTLPAG